ncbi:MAG: hypothetical protein R2939_19505 [Kofleriaceae bacterium]
MGRADAIAYLLSTRATAADTGARSRRLEVLGLHPAEQAIYLAAADGDDGPPQLARLPLVGPYAGHLVPLASWYAAEARAALPGRVRELLTQLAPLPPASPAGFALSTRVIQHRALRTDDGGPIRKFILQLTVDAGAAPVRAVVTALLRPRAHIDAGWRVPGLPLSLARVSYVGVASGLGLTAQTVLLVPRRLTQQLPAVAA